MKKIFLAFLILAACKENPKPDSTVDAIPLGSREFSIDSNASTFIITLVGSTMGPPDYKTVWSVIEEAQNKNWINSIGQIAPLIEGGIYHCITVLDASKRILLLEQLKKIPTSLVESHYKIQSVSECPQY